MPVRVAKTDFDLWISHLDNQPNKNLGVRHPAQWNMSLEHFNAMKKVSATEIRGHMNGGAFEIEYSIEDHGTYAVFVVTNATSQATLINDLTAEIARIQKRVTDELVTQAARQMQKAKGKKGWKRNRKLGQYYIERNPRAKPTATLLEAVNDGTILPSFAQSCEAWNLTLTKGRK